jgi:hypothetical protein
MFRNFFLINIILLIIIGFLTFKFYKILAHPLDIPSKPVAKKVKEDKIIITNEDKLPDKSSFEIIAEKDLFKPSRTAPLLNNTSKHVSTKDLPRLFGTIILNNERIALLEDPVTKITKGYHINDLVAGFVISEIQKDKVILLKDNKTVEVELREKKGFKPRRPLMPSRTFKRSTPPKRQQRPSSPFKGKEQ